MPITQSLNSKGNIKKFTTSDVPFSPQLPVTSVYRATSTLNQTVISNLGFSVDQTNTDVFWLFIDGKKVELGASADYVFTNILGDNTSSQVTFNVPLAANLNIEAFKLGFKKESEFAVDNRFTSLYEYESKGFQPFIRSDNVLTAVNGAPGAGQFRTFGIVGRASIPDITNDLSVSFGTNRIHCEQIYQVPGESGPNGEKVYALVNDTKNLIRMVGNWAPLQDSNGDRPLNASTAAVDYIEIVFYGTGINLLNVASGTRDHRLTVDGGAEAGSSFTVAGGSGSLNGSNITLKQVTKVVSGLAQGLHTIKIRDVSTTINFQGIEILNETSALKINPGTAYIQGQKVVASSSTPAYASGFTNSSGTPGARGSHVLVYMDGTGTIKKDVQYANTAQATLTSADHTNEDLIRTYFYREFNAGRTDDFSQNFSGSNGGYSLDDGTTTYVANAATDFLGTSQLQGGLGINGATAYIYFTFVGTGADVEMLVDASPAGSDTLDVLVDGVAIATNARPYNLGQGANDWVNVKLISGLTYGTHSIQVKVNTNTGGGDVKIGKWKIYAPKKPTLPSGCVELADYYICADPVGPVTAGFSGTGVIAKTSIREPTYIGTWTGGVERANPAYGRFGANNVSNNNGASWQYTFYGTGFEIQEWNQNSQFQLALNGSNLTSTNFPSIVGQSTSINMTFTEATGVLVNNNSGGGINRTFFLKNLPLATYVLSVTVINNNRADLLGFGYIGPIHAPKYDNPAVIANTVAIGSTSVSDNRKYSAIKEALPSSKGWSQSTGVTANPTTTSTQFVPVPDMSVTVNTAGGALEVNLSVTTQNSAGANTNTFNLYIDGLPVGAGMIFNEASAGFQTVTSLTGIFPVSPGVHTVSLYWKVNGGTGTANGIFRVISAKEI